VSYEEALKSISLDADASLAEWTSVPGQPGSADPNTGKMFRFVKVTGAHQVGLAVAAANEITIGVMQNKPQVVGQAATVAISGVSNVVAGGAVAAGDGIKVDAAGAGVKATAGTDETITVGVALGSAAAGQLFPCLLRLR
jgi:hypothetical protein